MLQIRTNIIKSIKLYILITFCIGFCCNVAGQGIICFPNTFWGRPNGGNINQYTITGNTVVMNSSILCSIPYSSLALCNNLDNGLFSPTFYTGSYGSGNFLNYYNGSGWVACQDTPICNSINSGGNGNFLYLLENTFTSSVNQCIQRHTDTSFTVIYNDTLLMFTVADIAVDEVGNIWSFTGQTFPDTEFITVLDSLGQVIKQYPFSLNTIHAYGCFLLNDILYLGLGNGNPTYPSTLLPISFSGNTASLGTPIPFVSLDSDLTSCDPGNPLFFEEIYPQDLGLLVYPSITTNNLNVCWNADPGSFYELKILDMSGRTVYDQSFKSYTDDFRTILDVKSLSNGIYTMHLFNGKYNAFRKFVKN